MSLIIVLVMVVVVECTSCVYINTGMSCCVRLLVVLMNDDIPTATKAGPTEITGSL